MFTRKDSLMRSMWSRRPTPVVCVAAMIWSVVFLAAIPSSRYSLAATSRPAHESAKADAVSGSKQLQAGLELFEKEQWLEARTQLSEALCDGELRPAEEAKAMKALEELAERTLLTRSVQKGDPYADEVELKPGEPLAKLVSREKLHMDVDMILEINAITDARKIRAGQKLKVLRGVVHAVVHKDRFLMDLYLRLPGQSDVFLKRVPIALGRNDGTPTGSWLVRTKTVHAPWTAPAEEGKPARVIQYDEPGYPLGPEGRWIALEGTDDETRRRSGYGIHGTNEPSSIGKAASHGCIRVGDANIPMVYWLMSPKESTVVIRED